MATRSTTTFLHETHASPNRPAFFKQACQQAGPGAKHVILCRRWCADAGDRRALRIRGPATLLPAVGRLDATATGRAGGLERARDPETGARRHAPLPGH